jgi:surface antigen
MSRWTTASFWALTGSMALIAAYPARAAPVAMIPGPEQADSIPTDTAGSGLPYLQCVPYARKVSGIQLFGDAHTWWDQAEGRYERGFTPKVGAVMSFHAHGAMRLGHVAMVSRIIDSRTVLLRHANWSPINGMRGQPEDDVRAVDVSDSNDWSEVRVWYAPIQDLGTTHWPVDGFIYNRTPTENRVLAGRSIWPAAKALSPQARHPGLPCSRPRRRNRPRQAATASTPVFSMA